MDRITYDNIIEFARSLSLPLSVAGKSSVPGTGAYFMDDEYCRLFGRIILERPKASNIMNSAVDEQAEEEIIRNGIKLTAKLTSRRKFTFFVLLYYYCTQNNQGNEDYSLQLKRLVKILGIDHDGLKSVEMFFNENTIFTRSENCIYLVHEKMNQLVKAKGVNVQFVLKSENEVLYLEYFKKYNFFLCRPFKVHRRVNSIVETVEACGINIIDEIGAMEYLDIRFEELAGFLKNHFPLQNVKSAAMDNTPSITLDAALAKVIISGSSSPLSPVNYFKPVYEWMNNFSKYGGEHLEVHLQFDYFNSYTSKFILNLTNKCLELSETGREVDFSWHYKPEDDETLDFGKDLEGLCKGRFKIKFVEDKTGIAV